MLTIGRYNDDTWCWGVSHNLYHRALLAGYEYIDIQLNGNNPPTLKQNSAFQIYKEVNRILSTDASGNTVFPASQTITNYEGEAAYTPTDQSYTWDSTNCLSTGVDATYYMYCRGAEDITSTSLGRAYIGISSTKTFTYNSAKGLVPYSTDNERALCKFTMLSNTLSGLEVFNKTNRKDIKYVSTAYTLTQFDEYLICNTTSLTLPNSSECYGKNFNIKNLTTECIMYGTFWTGATSRYIYEKNDIVQLCCNSSYWYVFSRRENFIEVSTTNGSTSRTLPDPAANIGMEIEYKLKDNAGNLYIYGLIEGSTYVLLWSQYDYLKLHAGSTQWYIIDKKITLDSGWINTNDWTNVHLGFLTFLYDGYSSTGSTWVVGETITVSSSGSSAAGTYLTGRLIRATSTELQLSNVAITSTGTTGVCPDNYKIIGSLSGSTATVNESTGSAKGKDYLIYHGQNISTDNINKTIWYNTTASYIGANERNSFDDYLDSAITGGCNFTQVDNNFLKAQTGNQGLGVYIPDDGNGYIWETDNGYYKIIIKL